MEERKRYLKPGIEVIVFDNEISLAMESEPPIYESDLIEKTNNDLTGLSDPFFT